MSDLELTLQDSQPILDVEAEEELVFRPTRTPFLKVATGGKGPPKDELPAVWLNGLEYGSLFLTRDAGNMKNFVLGMFILAHRVSDLDGNTFSHISHVNESTGRPDQTFWIDTREFCKQHKLAIVLDIIPELERAADEPDTTVKLPG